MATCGHSPATSGGDDGYQWEFRGHQQENRWPLTQCRHGGPNSPSWGAISSASVAKSAGEAAKAAGRLGRTSAQVTPEKIAAALALRAERKMTMSQVARSLGVAQQLSTRPHRTAPRLDSTARPDNMNGVV